MNGWLRLIFVSLISIITPSYNQVAYLEYTLQSVLAQDYPHIEYLVIDGGSIDGSLDIIRRYADRLAWWVSEPDAGQADAINKGFARARGEYIAWLNSDDLYLPGAVMQAVAVLQANPELGMVFGDAFTINSDGMPLNALVFGDWGLPDLMAFRIICQPAVFMRRSILERAGYLDSSYHYMLDHQLWLRLARLAPIRRVSQTWAAARHHAAAKNVAHAEAFGEEALHILEWMEVQPDLASLVAANRHKIIAGAYRLNGRYLLDGGLPAPALKSYLRALINDPVYTLKHGRRMAYAAASLVGLGGLADRLVSRQAKHPVALPVGAGENWPGLRSRDID